MEVLSTCRRLIIFMVYAIKIFDISALRAAHLAAVLFSFLYFPFKSLPSCMIRLVTPREILSSTDVPAVRLIFLSSL